MKARVSEEEQIYLQKHWEVSAFHKVNHRRVKERKCTKQRWEKQQNICVYDDKP